jgi:ectoine hydroxylase-related dioxygenase (phytanoyl-CoA dioxygenase family)
MVLKLIDDRGPLKVLADRLSSKPIIPVRILAFDKTSESNWALPWHQDRVVALRQRVDVPGFKNWTVKAGIPHAEPSEDILMGMLSLRLHLDDCAADNGALEVIPGSWRSGSMSDAEVRQLAQREQPAICEASIGDVVAMKALTVHASRASVNPSHRRVLHIDFSSASLPVGVSLQMTSA